VPHTLTPELWRGEMNSSSLYILASDPAARHPSTLKLQQRPNAEAMHMLRDRAETPPRVHCGQSRPMAAVIGGSGRPSP
jgi:hypothetical protein